MPKKSIKKSKDIESDDENNDNIDEDEVDDIVDEEEEDINNEDIDEVEEIDEYDINEDINCNIEEYVDEIYEDITILEPDTYIKKTNIEPYTYINKENRISINRLTKYEMVRILGEREKQLTMGAKPLVKNYGILSYGKIAEAEFKLNMIPYKIIRPLPNGNFELWEFDELYKEHLYSLLE